MKHLFRTNELSKLVNSSGRNAVCEIISAPMSGRTNFLLYEVAEHALRTGSYPIYIDANKLTVPYIESVITDVFKNIDNPRAYIQSLRSELEVKDYFLSSNEKIAKGEYNVVKTVTNLLFDLIVKLDGSITYLFDNANSVDFQVKNLISFSLSNSNKIKAYTVSPHPLVAFNEMNSCKFLLNPIEKDVDVIEHLSKYFSCGKEECSNILHSFNSMYWMKKYHYVYKITEDKQNAIDLVNTMKVVTFRELFYQQLKKIDLIILKLIADDKVIYSDNAKSLMSSELNEEVTNSKIQNSLLKLHALGITTSKSVKNIQIKEQEVIACFL
ncbi:hypothetical protein [Aliivibrio fischeri]|uniref:hypothetical protein n=1 Tax=Aliivibrio fischeri TaxID=668 RepID=UPI0007C4FE20|nr:hypothetical protein [Aliivibrio fischeri]